MVFGEEHVEEAQLLGPGFEVVNDRRVRRPSLFAFAELGIKDLVGGDAFFLNELFDLWSDTVSLVVQGRILNEHVGSYSIDFHETFSTHQVQCLLGSVTNGVAGNDGDSIGSSLLMLAVRNHALHDILF